MLDTNKLDEKEMNELITYCVSVLKDMVKTDRALALSLLIIIKNNHIDLLHTNI